MKTIFQFYAPLTDSSCTKLCHVARSLAQIVENNYCKTRTYKSYKVIHICIL